MPHMTHNYMLGLAVLLVSFVVLFYLRTDCLLLGTSGKTTAKAK
ncbi:hypothetical protein VF675_06355 [Acinetobacter sp. Lyrl_1]